MPKNLTKPNHIYSIHVYKENLALNNPQELICHKIPSNQILYILIYMYKEDLALIIFTNHLALVGYDTRSIFKRSLTGLNSEFSFSRTSCLTEAEEPSLPYYLLVAGGRIVGFILFLRALVLCEMQLASSRIWTRVVVSVSYDDNHYTTGTSAIWH